MASSLRLHTRVVKAIDSKRPVFLPFFLFFCPNLQSGGVWGSLDENRGSADFPAAKNTNNIIIKVQSGGGCNAALHPQNHLAARAAKAPRRAATTRRASAPALPPRSSSAAAVCGAGAQLRHHTPSSRQRRATTTGSLQPRLSSSRRAGSQDTALPRPPATASRAALSAGQKSRKQVPTKKRSKTSSTDLDLCGHAEVRGG